MGKPDPKVVRSLLAGLASESQDPDAADARFLARCQSLSDEDRYDIPGAGEDTDDEDEDETPRARESRALVLENFTVSEGAPGPPPRPGLVWNDSTHRWRHPETGEEVQAGGGGGARTGDGAAQGGGGGGLASGDYEALTVDVPDPEGDDAFDVRVKKNPSAEDVLKYAKTQRRSGMVKGLVVGDDLYIWTEMDVHHQPMADALGVGRAIPFSDRLMIQWDDDRQKLVIDRRSEKNPAVQQWAKQFGDAAIFESRLVLENFTGTVTDSAGHKRQYVNGKQVKGTKPEPDKGNAPATPTPESHAAELAKLADKVKPALLSRVSGWLSAKYKSLETKYGSAGAKLVLGATVLLAPIPLPGTVLVPVAVAEAVKRLWRVLGGTATEGTVTPDELLSAARDLLTELYAELGEELPELDTDRARAWLAQTGE